MLRKSVLFLLLLLVLSSTSEAALISLRQLRQGFGNANQVLGMNSAATDGEWKSILGTSNQITVTNGASTITLATPQDIGTASATTFLTTTSSRASLGTTSTDGLILTNPTAAAAGAQQISPRMRWTGQGMKTDAPAGSQTVDYIAQLVPVQGAANPQARLDFNYQINGDGYQAISTMSLLNGSIGIGEPNPQGILDINANSALGTRNIRLSSSSTDATRKSAILGARHYLAAEEDVIIMSVDANTLYSNLALGGDWGFNAVTNITFWTAADTVTLSGTKRMTIDTNGNIGFATASFGTNAARVLSFGGPATAPTTRPADVFTLYPIDVAGAGTMGLAWMSEDNGIGILGINSGFGTTTPGSKLQVNARTTSNFAGIGGYNPSGGEFWGSVDFSTGAAPLVVMDSVGTYDTLNIGGGILFGGQYAPDSGGYGEVGAGIKAQRESIVIGTDSWGLGFFTRTNDAALVEAVRITNAGSVGFGTVSPDRLIHPELADTTTAAVSYAQRLSHIVSTASTGSSDGFGAGLEFELETGTDLTNQISGTIESIWATAANATRKGRLNLYAYDTAARLGLTVEASGAAAMLGFFGVGAAVRPTAITQTYSTADKTHANFTSADLATTAATQTTPWGFATQAQADNIATQFNLLRADLADAKQLLNSLIDDLQTLGLEQ